MNQNEMEEYLINQAKEGFEAGVFMVGSSFYPIRDVGLSDDHFIGHPKSVADILDIGWPDVFIHTHLDCSSEPSKTDIEMMDAWNMDWWIYSVREGNIDEVWRRFQSDK